MRLSEWEAIAVALWVIFAHAHNEFVFSPYLAVSSPTPGCGKTRLLTVINELVPNPLAGSSLTAATIYHSEGTPTLLADELHGWVHKDKDLRGILNSGHDRKFAYVLRTVNAGNGQRRTERFSTWMPKALAGLGGLSPELARRSIHIRLQKKLPGEKTQDPNQQELHNLHRMIVRWVADRLNHFRRLDPEMPASLHNSARDNWKPLVTIAELAGGNWAARAREAATTIEASSEDDDLRIVWLANFRRAFEEFRADYLPAKRVVKHAVETGEGTQLSDKALADLMRLFRIKPKFRRVGKAKPARLYAKADFEDAWARYLPSPPVIPATPDTSATALKNKRKIKSSNAWHNGPGAPKNSIKTTMYRM
jgi:hypothetical protein